MATKIRIVTAILVLSSFAYYLSVAQDEIGQSSPKLTKTTALEQPFLQEDLSVVVGNVQRPNGIVWLNGHLFTQCNGDWTLYRVDPNTGETITFVFGVRNAHSMFAEGNEAQFNIWIPDFDLNSLVRVNQNRGAPATITSRLDGPWGIARFDDQHFLITNFRGNNVVKVNRSGAIEQVAAGFRSPTGIQIDRTMVYVANTGSARRAIEWFDLLRENPEPQSLVSGLQNVTDLVLAPDGFLYFTHALGTRGVVSRVDPEKCRDGGCGRDDIENVVITELPAPLAGLTISPDMRLFVHTIYRPEVYWVQLPELEDQEDQASETTTNSL